MSVPSGFGVVSVSLRSEFCVCVCVSILRTDCCVCRYPQVSVLSVSAPLGLDVVCVSAFLRLIAVCVSTLRFQCCQCQHL